MVYRNNNRQSQNLSTSLPLSVRLPLHSTIDIQQNQTRRSQDFQIDTEQREGYSLVVNLPSERTQRSHRQIINFTGHSDRQQQNIEIPRRTCDSNSQPDILPLDDIPPPPYEEADIYVTFTSV